MSAAQFPNRLASNRAFLARSESEIPRPRCALPMISVKLSSSGMFIDLVVISCVYPGHIAQLQSSLLPISSTRWRNVQQRESTCPVSFSIDVIATFEIPHGTI